ncbi:hypothetical protein [Chlorobium phaeobacteroides]|nr:hypothetical protein [Chlorobium phaeobacteroides]
MSVIVGTALSIAANILSHSIIQNRSKFRWKAGLPLYVGTMVYLWFVLELLSSSSTDRPFGIAFSINAIYLVVSCFRASLQVTSFSAVTKTAVYLQVAIFVLTLPFTDAFWGPQSADVEASIAFNGIIIAALMFMTKGYREGGV